MFSSLESDANSGPRTPAVLPEAKGEVIGNGSVRVALLVPKSAAGNAGKVAGEMRNAAAMAMEDFGGGTLQLVVKDTQGTPGPATDAAGEAVNEGSSIILGPLFAGNVSSVSAVALPRGRMMIAFSSDRSVAQRGAYLLSFLPDAVMERGLSYAASRGVRRVVSILPQGKYGDLADRQARATMARSGGSVVATHRYTYDDASVDQMAREATASIAGADALFIPDGGNSPSAILAALQRNGAVLDGKRLIGTGQWTGIDFRNPMLKGAWYADANQTRIGEFKRRYSAKYGADPSITAALAYDAVALVSGLARTRGPAGITSEAIENRSGFNGYTGIFRFRADGLNERAFTVYEVGEEGRTTIVSPAPTSFGQGS